MAECRTTEMPINAGRWRLRLIGSSAPLIKLREPSNRAEIVSSFEIAEARDYYVPNNSNVIMRYKAAVLTEDHLTTLQFITSKTDVYIKLTIYDNGEEMLSVTGKGVACIPAFVFMKDRAVIIDTGEMSRPGSKTCKPDFLFAFCFYFSMIFVVVLISF